jgi:hypothetical protein
LIANLRSKNDAALIGCFALAATIVLIFGGVRWITSSDAKPHHPSLAWTVCSGEQVSAPLLPGTQTLGLTRIRANRMKCDRALHAIRTGSFEITPAGPQFTTGGFDCDSPIGPPPLQAPPRSFRCAAGNASFRFTVPGVS